MNWDKNEVFGTPYRTRTYDLILKSGFHKNLWIQEFK